MRVKKLFLWKIFHKSFVGIRKRCKIIKSKKKEKLLDEEVSDVIKMAKTVQAEGGCKRSLTIANAIADIARSNGLDDEVD